MRTPLASFVVALAAAAAPLPAAAQEKPAMLRLGIVAPGGQTTGIAGLAQIRRAYTEASGLPVRIFAARDMAALVVAQAGGSVHYAIYSAAGYAAAQRACGCVEPLAAPVGSAGDTGLQAVVYARAGKAAALGDAARLRVVGGPAGVVGPQALALEALEGAGAGADVVFAASQERAERAFAAGEADVLIGWEPVADGAAGGATGAAGGSAARLRALGVQAADLAALWRSPVVRYGPHAVRSDLPDEIKRSLRTFLLHVHAQQPVVYDLIERGRLGGFAAVADADYMAAAAMVARAAE